MSARKPSAAERAVILAFAAGLNPSDAEHATRRTVDEAILDCEREGWIAPSHTPEWYEVTAAGREAVKR